MEMSEKIIVSEEYKNAVNLGLTIKSHAQEAQKHLFEVCKGLKEMRDNKLYKQLGYQNFNPKGDGDNTNVWGIDVDGNHVQLGVNIKF